MIRKFRAKRLKVKRPNQRVEVCLRHATGKLDLTLTSPVTVDITYPLMKHSGKQTKEANDE